MEIRTQNKYKKQKIIIKYAGESQINPAKQMEQNSNDGCSTFNHIIPIPSTV